MKNHNFVEQEKKKKVSSKIGQEEEEEEEWLKLGLGLGIKTTDISPSSCNKIILGHGSPNPALYSSPSSSQGLTITPHHYHHQEVEVVGFGLGLGLERGSSQIGGMVEHSASYCDHHRNNLLGLSSSSSLPAGHCNYYYDGGGNDMNDNNKLRPSSSSSCQIESQGLPISVPYCDQSHHYPHHHQNNGVWFTLHSSTNRIGEALPQIPKAYIRVRDENMTVLMVKKYLISKLDLSNEIEIEILCMGERLSQLQTLKEVRDSVWVPRLVESLNSTTLLSLGDSHDMSLHHIMSLLYRKHCFSN